MQATAELSDLESTVGFHRDACCFHFGRIKQLCEKVLRTRAHCFEQLWFLTH